MGSWIGDLAFVGTVDGTQVDVGFASDEATLTSLTAATGGP
jgi:hypothetical protein